MSGRTTVPFVACVGLALLLLPSPLLAQSHAASSFGTVEDWFSVLEIPFLVGCVTFAFLTAVALKGGRFGTGMRLIAWGFLVMAVGHVHMQIEMATGLNLFGSVLGATGGSVLWVVALMLTWGLSAAGFYQMYRASR